MLGGAFVDAFRVQRVLSEAWLLCFNRLFLLFTFGGTWKEIRCTSFFSQVTHFGEVMTLALGLIHASGLCEHMHDSCAASRIHTGQWIEAKTSQHPCTLVSP